MDQLDRYRAIVRRLIEEYASYKPAYGDIRTEAVVDRERDHYEVIQVGWDGGRRVHYCNPAGAALLGRGRAVGGDGHLLTP